MLLGKTHRSQEPLSRFLGISIGSVTTAVRSTNRTRGVHFGPLASAAKISHSGASILHFYHIDEDGTIRELASRKRDVTLLVR
jgi:hypothetical protein